jgi:AcrR family transcriptional regulator
MAESTSKKRKYSSSRRQEQAQETRRRILSAAQEQFTAHGYAGASIESIARAAQVSPLTVFAAFSNKRSILAELIHVAVVGDDQPIPILERPGPRAIMQEPDPYRLLHAFAADISDILERVAPLFEIGRMAAKTEPEIAALMARILDDRFNTLSGFVRLFASNHSLRPGLSEAQAAEIVWSITSPEMFQLMTRDRGWLKPRFAAWLGDTLSRLLLP